ncbi:MAG TPA: RtcB family protein, partial [Candidatus Hydrogenedentes bacterium]|nr:RtcB family protein [Candidatus Hydrogenedentota bacterium]
SMASPAYLVRGAGNPASLNSAAHGAGRRISRSQAKRTFRWADFSALLRDRGVKVLCAGIDEVPAVYKDIEEVMKSQQDLVTPVARFHPKLVMMAPARERPED